MTLLPEVCLGPRTNQLNFVGNPGYDTDTGSGLRSLILGGGLQSLTDCLVIYMSYILRQCFTIKFDIRFDQVNCCYLSVQY